MSNARDGAAKGEQRFYDRQAARFWDPHGPMRALHVINPLRAAWIEARANEQRVALAGARLLDVGCAVGLLSEAMARKGAAVTGIDVSEENIRIARTHAGGCSSRASRGHLRAWRWRRSGRNTCCASCRWGRIAGRISAIRTRWTARLPGTDYDRWR